MKIYGQNVFIPDQDYAAETLRSESHIIHLAPNTIYKFREVEGKLL